MGGIIIQQVVNLKLLTADCCTYIVSRKHNFSRVVEMPDCDANYFCSLSDSLSPVISATVTHIILLGLSSDNS